MAAPEERLPAATRASVERAAFIRTGAVPGSVREEVAASWLRSAALVAGCPADLLPARPPAPRTAEVEQLVRRLGGSVLSRTLLAHGLVLLLDADARVVFRWYGDDPDARSVLGPCLGDRVDERSVGTTAVALAADSGACEQAVGAEHLLPALVPWTSTAGPVRDLDGLPIAYVATFERAAGATVTPAWLQLVTGLLELEARRAG